MTEVKLSVVLLDMTTNPVDLIYAACRQCYSADFAGDIMAGGPAPAERETFIRRVVASGHESTIEHVKFTFAVAGVSRALTHQLVRHRLASYSQQSQRYVSGEDYAFIVPPSVAGDAAARAAFTETMIAIRDGYRRLMEVFAGRGITGEAAQQDARFVLPQAAETKIVVTMNARELKLFFRERCCTRAQWEIRALANAMLRICREALPCVFDEAGAKCESLGYCPEGARYTCGRYPLKSSVLSGKEKA